MKQNPSMIVFLKLFSIFISTGWIITKHFFLASDIDKLSKYKNDIDDEINKASYELLDVSEEIINARISGVEEFYESLMEKPFDFTKQEDIELDGEKRTYAKTIEELKERWRKSLKYQTMIRLYDLQKRQDDNDSIEPKSFKELEEEARASVLKRQKDWFRRMKKVERNDRLSLYINSITNAFDPHTGYFPPKDKEDFDIAMSGKLEGIGATLQEKDGYIKVVRIVPGSASWKQGELKAGDLILKVAQGKDEYEDIVDMRLDEAVKLIRGKKGTKVRLQVKKIDGKIMEIPIVRDVVVIEETYARSAILKAPSVKAKIGYINLPKFYVDFNDRNGPNCSRDIKKEIDKLNDDKVNGIIFDLRNNGGGSLPDVVKIGGYFIETGPIVQIKTRYGKPQLLEDDDPAIDYNGPIIFLVNSFSASASEILAAAMQDYNRAIIVGTPSTFGKGTVQRFFDLDNLINGSDDVKPLGAVKITTQKFYRINGGATQLKGVKPDIILDDAYSKIDVGEKEMDFPMQWSKIESTSYKMWNPSYKIETIKKKCYNRIEKNEFFEEATHYAERLKQQRDHTLSTLNFETFREEQKKLQDYSKKYNDLMEKETGLEVVYLKEDLPKIEADSAKQVRYKEWKEGLQKDIYLKEACNILNDML
jgi:carboxyl-terminal processing protease